MATYSLVCLPRQRATQVDQARTSAACFIANWVLGRVGSGSWHAAICVEAEDCVKFVDEIQSRFFGVTGGCDIGVHVLFASQSFHEAITIIREAPLRHEVAAGASVATEALGIVFATTVPRVIQTSTLDGED